MRRAFIIAVQRYDEMTEGLSPELPGTHQNALDFRKWAIEDQGVTPSEVYFCTDGALEGRTAAGDRKSIKNELWKLKTAGKDTTEALYFYFSGHGFCFVDGNGAPVADVLLGSDFANRDLSGDACLRLTEIQKWLRMCLGPGDHYYFIDACRNELAENQIQPIALGLNYDVSTKMKPTLYTMYSTSQGTVAPVGFSFPEALLDGLRGRGRAKVWRGPTVAVLFESVRAYAEKRLGKSLDPQKSGSNDGLIKEFAAIPTFRCDMTVRDAQPADRFQVTVKNTRGQQVDQFTFDGPSGSYAAPPDDYYLHVALTSDAHAIVTPKEPQLADLYDDCALQFAKFTLGEGLEAVLFTGRSAGETEPAPLLKLAITPPAHGKIRLTHVQRGETVTIDQPIEHEVPPGKYALEIVDVRGAVVDRIETELTEDTRLDYSQFRGGALRGALLARFPHASGAIYMSETLGPMVDQGLDLWLAVIGASRILGPQQFRKLGRLPLASFENEGPDAAPVYLLAGLEDADVDFFASISSDWRTSPARLEPHPQLAGLYELVARGRGAGHRFVTIRIGGRTPLTFGACTLPNRGTLVTITQDETQAVRIQQFMLPLNMPPGQPPGGAASLTVPYASDGLRELELPLRTVRRIVDVHRAFAADRKLRDVMTDAELNELLYFKWFEPIVALLAAYELVRRDDRMMLTTAIGNLRAHFPGIADSEALAKLAGIPVMPTTTPPLVLEGFQALNLDVPDPSLPPVERLDFSGPWTMWKAKV